MSSSAVPQPWFAPTRWSLVHRAQGTTEEARVALSELCEAYWQPVFRVLRQGGRDEESARDATQEFFAHLLQGGRIAGADARRGKFRSYLLGALRHFESDRRERERRLKRGGGAVLESLNETEAADPASDESLDDAQFDREWALTLLGRAVDAVGADYSETGKSAQFDRLKPSLLGGELPCQTEMARELGLTEGALKVAIHRLRRRFRDAVRNEIQQTLPEGGDASEELRYLIEVWSRV
jgi:RNA polymerase sigma-70 factor (ECF subfamily)